MKSVEMKAKQGSGMSMWRALLAYCTTKDLLP